jgi:VTC domain
MTTASPSAIAEHFGPISLAELEEAGAELLDRVDRKYVVSVETFAILAMQLGATHRILDIEGVCAFRYDTAYYDTPGLDAYRDHLQGRRRRYKCRSRRYEDTGACMFEVKLKGLRGRTVKHRMPYENGLHGSVSAEALRFLHDRLALAYGRAPGAALRRSLRMTFRRLTLVDVGRGDRLTCDFDLAFDGGGGGAGAGRLAEQAVILESKSARGRARADAALRDLGARHAESFSKYCLGIGMTRAGIRSNTYRRLLTRWFVREAARGGATFLGIDYYD